MEQYIEEIKDKLEEAKDNLPQNIYFVLLSAIINMCEKEIEL